MSESANRGAPPRVAIVGIGAIVSGDWRDPFVAGDGILCEDGAIAQVGSLDAIFSCLGTRPSA